MKNIYYRTILCLFSKKKSLNVELIFTKIHSGPIISAMAVCICMASTQEPHSVLKINTKQPFQDPLEVGDNINIDNK